MGGRNARTEKVERKTEIEIRKIGIAGNDLFRLPKLPNFLIEYSLI